MRSAIDITASAKAASPGGIMQADASVERHPVSDVRFPLIAAVRLFRTSQRFRAGLGNQFKNAGRGITALHHFSCHTAAVHDQRTIFVKPDMLAADINLHICIAKAIVVRCKFSAGVNRLSCCCQMLLDILCQLCRLLFLIDLPSIVGLGHLDALIDPGGRECLRLTVSVHCFCKACHIFI